MNNDDHSEKMNHDDNDNDHDHDHDNHDHDDEEDDEDYIPGADGNERMGDDDDDDDDDHYGNAAHLQGSSILSIAERKAADDAFMDLFGYPYQLHDDDDDDDNVCAAMENNCNHTKRSPRLGCTTTTTKTNRRAAHILSSIFGRRSTSVLLSNSKFNAKFARPKDPSISGRMIRLERRVVYDTKRFAGKEIQLERVVLVPVFANEAEMNNANARIIGTTSDERIISTTTTTTDTTTTTTTTAAAAATPIATNTSRTSRGPRQRAGLDTLLSQISRPDKLSTMSKTAADWDLFKSKNVELADKLEDTAVGNEAYLVKKDFLNRVDTRRFELEKAQRERERMARR